MGWYGYLQSEPGTELKTAARTRSGAGSSFGEERGAGSRFQALALGAIYCGFIRLEAR